MQFIAPNNREGPKKKIVDHTREELRAAMRDARLLFGDMMFYKMLYGIDAYMRLRDLSTADEMQRIMEGAKETENDLLKDW